MTPRGGIYGDRHGDGQPVHRTEFVDYDPRPSFSDAEKRASKIVEDLASIRANPKAKMTEAEYIANGLFNYAYSEMQAERARSRRND